MKLSLKEISNALDLPQGTIERWIRQGKIPVQKKSHDICLFNKAVLKRWAQNHNLSFTLSESSEESSVSNDQNAQPTEENLLAAMKCGGLVRGVPGEDAETIFNYVVNKVPDISPEGKSELVERLLQREELVSTGIGKGVAIPHPRSPMPELFAYPRIITCFLNHPVDFGAVDEKHVFVMFFLLSPTITCHLNLLSRLSFCLRDNAFLDLLSRPVEEQGLWMMIETLEKEIDGGSASGI